MNIYMFAAPAAVGVAQYWLLFHAPKMDKPICKQFILVKSEAEKRIEALKQKAKEEGGKLEWYEYALIYGITIPLVILAQTHFKLVGLPILILIVILTSIKWLDDNKWIDLEYIGEWIKAFIYLKLFWPSLHLKKNRKEVR